MSFLSLPSLVVYSIHLFLYSLNVIPFLYLVYSFIVLLKYTLSVGGVRHCRVPLSPEIKEALEVAYVSRIMSKNFRKEGQPEKERIARITGLEIDKVLL